tara:strand:- start:600 stop:872 length:273 start_codon:yes stop_codon:yes gene_type:complete
MEQKKYYDVMRRDYISMRDGVDVHKYRYFLVKTFDNYSDAKIHCLKCMEGDFIWYTEKVDKLSKQVEKQTGDIVRSVSYIVAQPHEELKW